MNGSITPQQVRAARSILGWTQRELSSAAEVGSSTLADFERGARNPCYQNLLAIRRTLEGQGIIFVLGGVKKLTSGE